MASGVRCMMKTVNYRNMSCSRFAVVDEIRYSTTNSIVIQHDELDRRNNLASTRPIDCTVRAVLQPQHVASARCTLVQAGQ